MMSTRYLVPDLSPKDRLQLNKLKPRFLFVAESPHISEITPDKITERRPLCGAAGKQWWNLLSELLDGVSNTDVSLSRQIDVCTRHRFAVMNAVQYPLDQKIIKEFPEADPIRILGFNKISGPHSFKKLKKTTPVLEAIEALRNRLVDSRIETTPIICLGNDAEWFVRQALDDNEYSQRVGQRIPHPSAWWRRGGLFGRIAREKITELFH